MKALNLTKKNYVLKEEKGSGSPTTFVIKGLNGLQMLELSNAETDPERVVTVLEMGLVGWKGMEGEEGQVAFDKDDMSANLGILPLEVMSELVEEIMDMTTLREDQVKN